jgi:hypothetical protein
MPSLPASLMMRATFEPPPVSCCHRLRWLDPITIWVIWCSCAKAAVTGAGGVAAGDVEDVEFSPEPGGHPGRPPDQGVGPRNRADRDHDPFAGLPHRVRLVPAQVVHQFLVGLVGQEPQRKLPQRGQVVGTEEVGQGPGDPFLRVDVPVQHAAAELLRRGVDKLDLVRLAHHPVRDAFADPRPGHVLDLVGDEPFR